MVYLRRMYVIELRRRLSKLGKLKLFLRRLSHRRTFYVLIVFLIMLSISSVLFYYVEHVIHGRDDVDFPTAVYWALVTMATVGYGDVVVTHDVLGYAIAGATAVMGIATYMLVISTLTDTFFSATLKKTLGRGKMKKKILVIGTSPSCREAIDELVVSGYADITGWVLHKEPKALPPVDFVVGDYTEETLLRAGVRNAEKIILCLENDSSTLHLTLLIRRLNRRAKILALVNDPSTAELLKELGITDILTHSLLGRIAALAIFEPTIIMFVRDVVTSKGKAELTEVIVAEDGLTIGQLEKMLMKKSEGYRFEIIAVRRDSDIIYAPENDMVLRSGDRLVVLKTKS